MSAKKSSTAPKSKAATRPEDGKPAGLKGQEAKPEEAKGEEAKAPAKTPKARKAKAEAKPKKLSAIDAAARVLGEAGESMNCQDMIKVMAEKGYGPRPAARRRTPRSTPRSCARSRPRGTTPGSRRPSGASSPLRRRPSAPLATRSPTRPQVPGPFVVGRDLVQLAARDAIWTNLGRESVFARLEGRPDRPPHHPDPRRFRNAGVRRRGTHRADSFLRA
jgi:hypothetical protein